MSLSIFRFCDSNFALGLHPVREYRRYRFRSPYVEVLHCVVFVTNHA